MNANPLSRMLRGGCLAAALAITAGAAPLQRADVPANPAWVVHFDIDALRPTVIGQYLLDEMDQPEAQAKLAAFQTIFHFNARTQLHGLTLYSPGAARDDGILLVYADFDAGQLVTLARAVNDSRSITYNQHTIYNWIDESKKARNGVQRRVYAAIEGARVVFGQREACVARALDVLDGKAPPLAPGSLLWPPGPAGSTSLIEAAARKVDLRPSDPSAALFGLSKLVRLRIGEGGQQVTATLSLEANDNEIAKNMAGIGRSLVSLMKLQKEKPELARLAEAISIKQDGAAVVATLAMPADDVVALLKADAARKTARKPQQE